MKGCENMNIKVEITMMSGETIRGILVKSDKFYKYVETKIDYDELAIDIFGKEYCDKNKTLINKLPIDEIKEIKLG